MCRLAVGVLSRLILVIAKSTIDVNVSTTAINQLHLLCPCRVFFLLRVFLFSLAFWVSTLRATEQTSTDQGRNDFEACRVLL